MTRRVARVMGQNEAYARILIDKALESSGWDLLNPQQVRFEQRAKGDRADYILKDKLGRVSCVLEAKREMRSGGRPKRGGPDLAPYRDCAVGPMGCGPQAGINLLAAALTAAEMAKRLSEGKEVGTMFKTTPTSSEYQLYQAAKERREAEEADKAGKAAAAAAKAKAEAKAEAQSAPAE